MRTLLSRSAYLGLQVLIAISGLLEVAPSHAQQELRLATPEARDPATEIYVETFLSRAKEKGVEIEEVYIVPNTEVYDTLVKGGDGFDLALFPAGNLPGLYTDPSLTYTSLISQPGIIADATENFAIQASVIGDLVASEIAGLGLTVVGFWNRPSQTLVSTKYIATSEELRGANVASSDEAASFVLSGLGASVVPLRPSDLPVAMQTGVVDAAEIVASSLSEFASGDISAEWRVVNNYAQNQGFLLVNSEKWLRLSQKERAVIGAAEQEALNAAQKVVLSEEDAVPKIAEEFGASYTPVDSSGWRPLSTAVINVWMSGVAKESRETAYRDFMAVKENIRLQKDRRGALPDGHHTPPVLFATNRNDEGTPELDYRFGVEYDASNQLLCGRIAFNEDPRRNFGKAFEGPISLHDDKLVRKAEGCMGLLAETVGAGEGLVIFFHGFNNSFSDAVRHAIGFADDFGLDQTVLVWSWPSIDSLGQYLPDLRRAEFTKDYVRQMVVELATQDDARDITVVAHSMGSLLAGSLLEHALSNALDIANLVLIAPDFPQANFTQIVTNSGTAARLKTVYANQHDRALMISMRENREAPIGLGGDYLRLVPGVETIDVSDVAGSGLINHSHGFEIRAVADDVSRLVLTQVGADERNLPSDDLNGQRYWQIMRDAAKQFGSTTNP